MKVRGGPLIVENLSPAAARDREVKNAPAEIRRVVKRLRRLLVPHFESAGRLGVLLGPDDLRAVIDGLLAEADGLKPDSHLHCPDEVRQYLRRTMFDELLGEPSNTLYATPVAEGVIRYEAMPAAFWKDCLRALRERLGAEQEGNDESKPNGDALGTVRRSCGRDRPTAPPTPGDDSPGNRSHPNHAPL